MSDLGSSKERVIAALRDGDRCRNYGPERTENEDAIVVLADEVERLQLIIRGKTFVTDSAHEPFPGHGNANTAADRPSAITAGEAAARDGDLACPAVPAFGTCKVCQQPITSFHNISGCSGQPTIARDSDLYEWVSGLVEALNLAGITRAKGEEDIDTDYLAELHSRLAPPPFLKRRPYPEEIDTWASAEDERDWWRNYALQIEGACLRPTKRAECPHGKPSEDECIACNYTSTSAPGANDAG